MIQHRFRSAWGIWCISRSMWDISIPSRFYRTVRFLITGYTGQFQPGAKFFESLNVRIAKGGWAELGYRHGESFFVACLAENPNPSIHDTAGNEVLSVRK